MTLEQMKDAWHSQAIPSHTREALGQIISQKNTARKRQLVASFVIAVVAVGFGLLNFCGQYFWNGNSLLVSSLRALPVLAATGIHIVVCRRLAREQRERRELAASHTAWLKRWIGSLETEVRGPGRWKLLAFFSFLIAIASVTKWLDYQSGEDSAAECIAIVAAVITLCLFVSISLLHYRTQFLIPELHRCRQMLDELRGES